MKTPPLRGPLCTLAILGPLLLSPAALAQGLIDPETGRQMANWPPPRHFDHLHMRLELDIPDMDRPELSAVQTLTVAPIGRPRSELVLNGVGMTITDVAIAGRSQAFHHDGQLLRVRFDAPIATGVRTDVVIRYTLSYPHANGAGLSWSPGDPAAENETDRAAQIHTQGQPDSNRLWFPCHDFPNERLTTELIVTTEDGYQVCSNGRLVARTPAEGRPGLTTWHWLQDKPHANYLVSLVVGRFSIVELPPARGAAPADFPITLYVPVGAETSAAAVYADTPAMLAFFAEKFDEPYPWDKYAQLCVRNFFAGGMENTSATTMQDVSAYERPGGHDRIIAHEAGHQWFGDLITCKSWEHIWLNEGWASMCEALWAEHDAPEGRAKREYQRTIAGFLAQESGLNRTYAPDYPGLASNRYNAPLEVFMRANNAYAKGAVVLHMLRARLGDEVFFRAVREYVDRFRFKEVETDDFRRVLEEVSGESLERFFDQWVRRPGLPRLKVKVGWDDAAGELRVSAEQTQRIDADNPAFAFSLPIYVTFDEGPGRYVYLHMDAREAEATFKLPSPPADAVVDPNMTVAAPSRIEKSLAMWLRQLDHAPSYFAHAQAINHLAASGDPRALAALARHAVTVPDLDPELRLAAAAGVLHGASSNLAGAIATAGRSLHDASPLAAAR